MTKKIVALGASNSRNSINRKLAQFAAQQVEGAEVDLLDLNDYEMPIYSIDREKESGIPQLAIDFKEKISNADGVIISFAEHNGAYSAAFKNIMDWMSRLQGGTWANRHLFLLATSPGKRGGKKVLELATTSFPYMDAASVTSFSLPSFNQTFSETAGITDATLKDSFTLELQKFITNI